MNDIAAERRRSLHGHGSSRMTFVLAVSGSAVGLGNIWKFPYVAGINGGGAFVIIYLTCVLAVGLPIIMAEMLIGRRGRRNPIATMTLLGEEEASSRHWRLVGVAGIGTACLILSFYSVIAGWCTAYIFAAARGSFTGGNAAVINGLFTQLQGDWRMTGLWHTVFLGLTTLVVARGVQDGLERAVRVLMPALIILLVLMVGYSAIHGSFAEGVGFLFKPKFADLTAEGALMALGQAFFTLSIGMGAVMAYGANLPEDSSIAKTALAVTVADTAIAMLAGLVIFPLVFANGLDPASGPGLIFNTLPLAFGNMPGGPVIAAMFFLLLTFAAWTSALSLIEPPVAWLIESRGLPRPVAALLVGIAVWAVGWLSVLSFNAWKNLKFWRGTFFDNIDFLTSNIMLPLGGVAITLFAGWVMARNSTADELDPAAGTWYRAWRVLARFVAPLAVVLILLNAVGVL